VHDRRPRAARASQMVHRRATPLPASPGRRSVAACARRSSLGHRRQAQPPAALPPHGCPVAAQPKILHTWHSGVRSTPSRRTIASPKSVTARSLGFGNLGLGETKVRRRGKMARGHFRLLERCVLLRLAVPMEGGGSATAAGSGHGEEGARMRWAVRRLGVRISDISRASGSGPPQPTAGATTTAAHGSTGPDHCSCCHGHGCAGLAQPPPNAAATPPRGERMQGLPPAQEARASHCCHAVSTPDLSIFFENKRTVGRVGRWDSIPGRRGRTGCGVVRCATVR